MTLRQLREFISEVFIAKKKHDAQSLEQKQTRETMEQFMFTFLN